MFAISRALFKIPTTGPVVPSYKPINVDSSRFRTVATGRGKKTSSIFKSSFFDNEAEAAILGKTNASPRRPRRQSPFILKTEKEITMFNKLQNRNQRELKKANPQVMANTIKKLAKLQGQTKKGVSNKRNTSPKRQRIHSSFYNDPALRLRKGSYSVPAKNISSSVSKSVAIDPMSPINIPNNFFTSYEHKQFRRLKSASRTLRRTYCRGMSPGSSDLSKKRAFYGLWDRLQSKVLEG
eukprot:Tbor_TRINITY_DN4420_c0_g1::TRINITY_DN4420_c0_g1_i1::g.8107::m.8107